MPRRPCLLPCTSREYAPVKDRQVVLPRPESPRKQKGLPLPCCRRVVLPALQTKGAAAPSVRDFATAPLFRLVAGTGLEPVTRGL